MPTFRYVATDQYGSQITGNYEASTEQEVRIYLRRANLAPSEIKRSWLRSEISLSRGHKPKDLVVFTRMFGAMTRAAVPVDQALSILHVQTDAPALKRAIQRMIVDVESGLSLSEAMRNQAAIFDSLYTNMIAAGESSGNLDTMLERLAMLLERTEAIRSKVKGAMVYPAALAVVSVGVVVAMLLFVVPQFVDLFTSIDAELPALTKMMLALSDFFQNSWWVLVLQVAAGVLGLRWANKKPGFINLRDRTLLRMKVIGDIIQKGAIARFSRTLSTLISSGVDVLDGLDLTAETAGNVVIAAGIQEARTAVAIGSDLAPPLRDTGVFPPLVTSMIAIGEQSGELDAMLDKVADFYEEEVALAIDSALKLIEPIMLVVMGSIVGLIMASVYLPLFEMIGTIGS